MNEFDVVISGVSGRFPECDGIDVFKNKLYNCDDFISFNDKKWSSSLTFELGKKKVPYGTGKFIQIQDYDAMVFRINKLFARSNDPINRKILEPAFEALVDSGTNPYSLSGTNVGVYTSYGVNEVDNRVCVDDGQILMLIGANKTMMANRISFAFDLKGSSFTYNTDILGTLEAFATGYREISNGYVDAAIVGVCSSIVEPALSLNFLQMEYLSHDARTRVFSKDANGYGRSEGCVLFFLQRAEDAKRVYAKIKLCETYYSGIKLGTILQYDEKYVKNYFETIYKKGKSDVDPADLAYLEMNACGIKRLDSIEANVVDEFFCKNRKSPLLIGSIKSNTGNTEAAAPFMSLLKTILAFETGIIAPNINFNEIDRDIEPLNKGTLQVVSCPTPLPGDKVGVNTISFIGQVGHAVLQKSETFERNPNENLSEDLPRLLLICGRSEASLISTIEKIESKPFNAEFVSLVNDVFCENMISHTRRGYTILPKPFKPIHEVQMGMEHDRPIWYLFTGMGSQWNGMGLKLLDLPIFAEVVQRCDTVLKPNGVDIYEVLTTDDPAIFNDIVNSFVGIITIQIGLTEVLRALGLQPDGIIGHSVGENACAYADGCLTLEQAVLASYARGVASTDVKTVKGMMAAVGKGYQDLKNSLPGNIEVACHNSASSCTLSGPAEEVENFVAELQKQKVFAKAVNVANIAYHSKNIAPVGPGFVSRLKNVITSPKQRSSKWISTSIPEARWDEPLAKYCSAEYLTNNLLNPVLFEEGCKHIPNNAIVIEIAPHGLLQAIVKKSLPESCTNVPLTLRSKTKDNLNFLLSAIGKLYIAGCNPNVNALFPKVTYPVSPGTPALSPLCTWDRTVVDTSNRYIEPTPMEPLWGELIHILVNDDAEYAYLRQHKVNGEIVIPSGFYIYLAWWIISIVKNKELQTIPILFEDVKFHRTLTISWRKPRSFSIMIQKSGYFELLVENREKPDKQQLIVTGKVTTEISDAKVMKTSNIILPSETKGKIDGTKFYDSLAKFGYQMDGIFSSVDELSCCGPEYYGNIFWKKNWVAFFDSLMKMHMFSHIQENKGVFYPSFIRRLFVHDPEKIVRTKDSILCYNDTTEKIIRCCGIEMFGLEFKPFVQKSLVQNNNSSKLKAYKFVEYLNPQCQDSPAFLRVCLQIIADNLAPVIKKRNEKCFIVENSHPLTKIIAKLVKENDYLKTRTDFFSANEISAKLFTSHTCLLKIVDYQYTANGLNADQLFLILLLRGFEKIPSDIEENFVEISKQSFSNERFCLLKKKPIKNDYPQPVVVEIDNWNQIENITTTDTWKSVVVARKNFDFDDLTLILKTEKEPDQRFLYILDEEHPSLENETFLNEILLNLDFPISIFKNGNWGFYKDVSDETIQTNNYSRQNKVQELFSDDLLLDTAVTHYLCPEESTLGEYENLSRATGYAGIHTSGKRIIGLTLVNSFEPVSNVHQNFTWIIPDTWSLEDAVTIPAVFAQAYNIIFKLKTVAISKSKSSVLINMGKEYLLAEACILVALHSNISVYVSVSNGKEFETIRKKFPQLTDDHVLCADNCTYETQILRQTAGLGVNSIINCLPGIQNMTACLNCVSKFGVYVEMADSNFNDMNELGLYQFLKSVSLYAVPNRISTLLKLRDEDQKSLKSSMQEGIDCGVVKPFSKILNNDRQNDELAEIPTVRNANKNSLKNIKKLEKTERLRYGSNYSYIIIGNEKKDNSWFSLVEWLISKGARKLILAVNNFTMAPKISYQLNKLLSQNNAMVTLTPMQKTDSIIKATELLDEAEKFGQLEAIFFVCTESGSHRIHNVDIALRKRSKSAHMISIFSGGLKECERRQSYGFPAVVVHADDTKKISTVFPHLDDILTKFDCNSPTLYNIVNLNSMGGNKTEHPCLNDHLPNSMKELEDVGYRVTQRAEFKEIGSLSLSFKEALGVYPIFVVPAIHGDVLKPLIRKLIYPVFCATLSESGGTAAQVASYLFTELNKIQATGPVTLLGETWSSGIAIELSKLVKQSNRQCKLLLIEANPNIWRNTLLNEFGSAKSPKFDTNLVKKILNIPNISSEVFAGSGITFEKRLKKYLSGLISKDINDEFVIKAIVSLRNRLVAATQYEPSEQLWENLILFAQQFTENQPLQLSVTSSMIVLEENEYKNFVHNTKIVQTINENALFSWWEYTKC